jgi:hypothetical protein
VPEGQGEIQRYWNEKPLRRQRFLVYTKPGEQNPAGNDAQFQIPNADVTTVFR